MKKGLFIYTILSLLIFKGVGQSNSLSFPYKLSNADYAWIGAGIITWGTGYIISQSINPLRIQEIDALNANQVNGFDRSATNKWNTQLDDISHIGKYALALSPALLMIPPLKNKAWQPLATYGVMYFETALLTAGITNLSKSLSQRIRPYYYNQTFTSVEKQALGKEYGEQDSFFSGHAAIAFSSAVFLSSTYTQIYGKNTWSKIIWASSIAIATGTTYLRYESGHHFPTDLITGAAIGASIGYLIPYFHKSNNEKLGLYITPNQCYLSYQF